MAHQKSLLIAVTDMVELAQLEEVANRGGFEVEQVQDAASLIQLAQARRPAAIIMDHDFGSVRGGLTLSKHLKSDPATRALAIILVCGRNQTMIPTTGTDGRPDEVLVRPLHDPEVLVRLGTVQRLHKYASKAVQGSRMDTLTGTFNHAYLVDRLRHEVLRASRYGRSLALVLIDVDGFARFNEREGSTCGDLMLREVARALTSRLRGVDLVARTGADEFSVVLPETSLLVARPIAERLRDAVGGLRCMVPDDEERVVMVTASVGIAGLPHPEVSDVPSLLRCAREALNRASRDGGNQTSLY